MRKNPLSAAIIIFCVCLATVSCGGGQQTDSGDTGSNRLETYDDPAETPQVDLSEHLCEEGWEIFDRAESDFGDQAYRYIFVIYRESKTAERSEGNILKNEGGYIAEYDYETGVARIREKKAEKMMTKEEELEKGSVDIGDFEVGDGHGGLFVFYVY